MGRVKEEIWSVAERESERERERERERREGIKVDIVIVSCVCKTVKGKQSNKSALSPDFIMMRTVIKGKQYR